MIEFHEGLLNEKTAAVPSLWGLLLADSEQGYAFAFQALGAIYWKYGKERAMDDILEKGRKTLLDFLQCHESPRYIF